jgi:hypothetical protein
LRNLAIGVVGLIIVGAIFYMLLMREKGDGLGFLAWLPMLIAIPIILYLYASSFLLMVMTATWW